MGPGRLAFRAVFFHRSIVVAKTYHVHNFFGSMELISPGVSPVIYAILAVLVLAVLLTKIWNRKK
jgi:hypothetical protein